MSIDLFLRCKRSPRIGEIERVILPLGWVKQQHCSDREERIYRWFHTENYESIRGCWLFIRRAGESDPKFTKLVFHAYSNAGRSHEDYAAQNGVIKALRKAFGGGIYNPQEGKQSYLVNDIPKLSPAEKACGFKYIDFQHNLNRASLALSDISEKLGWDPTLNIGLIRNNTLLPFVVASLESFFKEFFIAYVETHPNVQEKIYEKKSKIEYAELKKLLSGEKTIAQHEADNYTFQNLYSASNAYKTYVGVDIFKVLDRRKKSGTKVRVVRDVIMEMLDLRHRIIHAAHLETSLDRERMLIYISYTRKAGQLFVDAFLSERQFRIDLDEWV
ncbi:hypothetical protein HUS23_08590 [Ectothiorhodospiraceae bacterium 2226]|nr:hypothetical protein HUS23_08590 [Ectothiorhodospiraceae bacterium 2226]